LVTFKATDFKATKKQIEFIESRIRINLDCVQERFIKETRLAKREHINGVNFISLNDIIFKPKSCGPKT